MKDYLVRAITKDGGVRGLACITTQLANTICHQSETYPTATVALGRALTGGALMGALLKDGQRVALKFEGNGPLKKILVEADSEGNIRGYVGQPKAEIPLKQGDFDVARALGHAGFLTVTKDLRLKDPYRGIVQLYTSEIAEDLAYYLTESEQIPSAVGLGVFVETSGAISSAGGFLIQSLPPGDEELVGEIIRHIETLPPLTELLSNGKSSEEILKLLFQEIPFEILGAQSLAFRCSCSKDRTEQALITLGTKELTSMIQEQEQTEVVCEFCQAHYTFTRKELEQLLRKIH